MFFFHRPRGIYAASVSLAADKKLEAREARRVVEVERAKAARRALEPVAVHERRVQAIKEKKKLASEAAQEQGRKEQQRAMAAATIQRRQRKKIFMRLPLWTRVDSAVAQRDQQRAMAARIIQRRQCRKVFMLLPLWSRVELTVERDQQVGLQQVESQQSARAPRSDKQHERGLMAGPALPHQRMTALAPTHQHMTSPASSHRNPSPASSHRNTAVRAPTDQPTTQAASEQVGEPTQYFDVWCDAANVQERHPQGAGGFFAASRRSRRALLGLAKEPPRPFSGVAAAFKVMAPKDQPSPQPSPQSSPQSQRRHQPTESSQTLKPRERKPR